MSENFGNFFVINILDISSTNRLIVSALHKPLSISICEFLNVCFNIEYCINYYMGDCISNSTVVFINTLQEIMIQKYIHTKKCLFFKDISFKYLC